MSSKAPTSGSLRGALRQITLKNFRLSLKNELIVAGAGAILRVSTQYNQQGAFGSYFTLNPSFVAGVIPKRLWCLLMLNRSD